MRYRVVNRPAFFPTRSMGQNQVQDQEAVRKAKTLYEKVRANYANLANILGKDKADQALEEARENITRAEKEAVG